MRLFGEITVKILTISWTDFGDFVLVYVVASDRKQVALKFGLKGNSSGVAGWPGLGVTGHVINTDSAI